MLKTVSLTGAMRQNAGQESEKCLIGEVRMDSMRQNAGQENENCPIGEARLDSMRQKSKKKAKNCLIERSYGTKCSAKE